jgi:hypothetical protein
LRLCYVFLVKPVETIGHQLVIHGRNSTAGPGGALGLFSLGIRADFADKLDFATG